MRPATIPAALVTHPTGFFRPENPVMFFGVHGIPNSIYIVHVMKRALPEKPLRIHDRLKAAAEDYEVRYGGK